MRATSRLPVRLRRGSLLAGCGLGAVLIGLANPAAAQSFQGTPDTVVGTATFTEDVGTTTVDVYNPETVINWTATDLLGSGAINFQPEGTTATFRGAGDFTDFTVLNRILPVDGMGNPFASTVALNGTVISLMGDGSIGGNIWFYSPTGIIVGPKAVMNVGGLLLTTNDIQFVPNDELNATTGHIYEPGNLVQFRGDADSKGFVEVQPGASLTATGYSSYVGLIAPRVVQGGSVSADRSIAYIGAEQLDMTINGGLFDFTVTVGTTDANGVVHTGDTTGSQSTSYYDTKRIAVVAVPKNDAVTMLLAGSIGYQPAANVYDDGSSIVLAAGFDTVQPNEVPANELGNIAIDGASFSNPLTAYASNDIDLTAFGTTTSFYGSSTLYAGHSISVVAATAGVVSAANDLNLYAGRPGQGGYIDMSALSAGTISVGTSLYAYASSDAAFFDYSTPYTDGRGGSISLLADGGTISAQYDLYAYAVGYGYDTPQGAGDGIGGSIDLTVKGDGTIAANYVSMRANGQGGQAYDYYETAGPAGLGRGGSISVMETGGQINASYVYLSATGEGGSGSAQAGDGIGGTIAVDLTTNSQDWYEINADASASAGYVYFPGIAGNATAQDDAVRLTVSGTASLNLTYGAYLTADALSTENGAPGYTGTAGGVTLEAVSGGAISADYIQLEANALVNGGGGGFQALVALTDGIQFEQLGGPSNYSSYSVNGDTTPTLLGGTATLLADGGSINGRNVTVDASAQGGGAYVTAGTATGGTAQVIARNSGSITVADQSDYYYASLEISADGYGGPGPSPADSFGGTARLVADDGTISIDGDASVTANAWGLNQSFLQDGDGFSATGGNASVEILAGVLGTGSITANNLSIQANGDAKVNLTSYYGECGYECGYGFNGYGSGDNAPVYGNAGDGFGGTASLIMGGGVLSADYLNLDSSGYGGASDVSNNGSPFQSGSGFGGTSQVLQTGGTVTLYSLSVASEGDGGYNPDVAAYDYNGPTFAALAGNGTGGTALVRIQGGSLTADYAYLDAEGYGADGMNHQTAGTATDGGVGTGGVARLESLAGATGSFVTSELSLDAEGYGGYGGESYDYYASGNVGQAGNGGVGIGGTSEITWADGEFSLGGVSLNSDGHGGDVGYSGLPGVGGEGYGGSATFSVIDSSGPTGSRSLYDLYIFADGYGGYDANDVTAPSYAGDITLDVEVANLAAAVVADGQLLALSRGDFGDPGAGFTAIVSGAPLAFAGNGTVDTARDAVILASDPLTFGGSLGLGARSLTETGQLSADGYVDISAPEFIDAERISAGGGATLLADNGPLSVSIDLASAFGVIASAQSIDIHSLGALSFSYLQASAGDLAVTTVGDLTIPIGNATGDVTLASTNGTILSDNGLTAGGNFSASGFAGLNLQTVNSGGTTFLQSLNGAVSVPDLYSPGAVTALGTDVSIASQNDLSFADLQAFTGNASVMTPGNLTIAQANIAGDGTFFTQYGSITGTGAIVIGGNASFQGEQAIDLAALTSGGTNLLQSNSGPVSVDDLRSVGLVTAYGTSFAIGSGGGALSFADLFASGGDVLIQATGDLSVQQVTATGAITLGSSAGALAASNSLNAGTTVQLSGLTGVTAGSVDSGSTTTLASANGTILISDLNSPGLVTATGGAIDITSPGALAFADAQATSGALKIATQGDLSLAQASAFGALDLSSAKGAISGTGPISAGGNASVVAPLGITLAGLSSGGTTLLQSTNGFVAVTGLSSVGSVLAGGTNVSLSGLGDLSLAFLLASAGDGSVSTSGNLSVAQANVTGSLNLSSDSGTVSGAGPLVAGLSAYINGSAGIDLGSLSAGGSTSLYASNGGVSVASLTSGGPVYAYGKTVDLTSPGALTLAYVASTAGDLSVVAAGDITLSSGEGSDAVNAFGSAVLNSTGGAIISNFDTVTAGGNVTLRGLTGITVPAVYSGGTTRLDTGTTGTVDIAELISADTVIANGGDILIGSTGGLTFSSVDAGNVTIDTAGNLGFGTLDAGGDLSLSSANGTITSTGLLAVVGNAALSAATGIDLSALTAGGTTLLDAAGGPVHVGNLNSGGLVTAFGQSFDIGSTGALSFAALDATAGNATVVTAGNLAVNTVDATGAVSLSSTGGSLTASGAINAGGALALTGATGLTAGTAISGGTTLLQSTNGAIAVSALTSPGAVTALGRSITLASPGALTFADIDATAGAASVTTAGNLAVNTVDATGAVSLSSTGGTLIASNTINSGGATTLSGANGLALGSLNSAGTTSLQSANGTVAVTGLSSTGAITASGTGIAITGTGALSFADLDATAGNATVSTAGNLAVNTVDATGAVSLSSTGGSLTASGAINAGGALALTGATGLTAGTAISGGTTLLQSTNGAISVSALTSPGAVTASGQGVTITSPGALSFANAQATAGNLAITTQGNLALAQGGASGALTLSSVNGTITGTGPLSAGGNVSVIAPLGVNLASLSSGGTTLVRATSGAVSVGQLISSGLVTARGLSVTLASTGALSFADLDATGGALSVTTAGNLVVATVDATGAVTLASSGGSLSAAGPVNSGGALALGGASGLSAGTLNSAAATSLQSANGGVTVASLTSAGAVTAQGRSVSITSPGALSFADLDATAGSVSVTTAGNLGVSTVDATSSVSLTSTGGNLTASGAINAGGALALNGATGLTAGTAISGGTTLLQSTNGAIAVSALTSPGAVTALGRSLTIASPGALTFADIDATAGTASVTTAGNLAVNTVDATGAVSLTSTGGTLSASNTINSGGALALNGSTGLTAGTLNSGGTTLLQSTNGAIAVSALTSAGAVTAQGRSVSITSPGALSFADLDATAGNATVSTAGNLAVNTVDATGAVSLSSTGGSLTASGAINSGGALALNGSTGLTAGTLNSGGTTLLQSTNGAIAVSALTSPGAVTALGRSLTIASTGALTFADIDATAGAASVTTAGNLAVNTVDGTGGVSLTSTGGTLIASNTINSGGATTLSGANGLVLSALNSAGTTSFQSANGAVAVTGLSSNGAITASGTSISIAATGPLSFASATAAGALALTATGNLTASGNVAGGTVTLGAGGNLSAGGNVVSGGALTISAGGTFALSGSARGTSVTVTAADVALGATAQLGQRGLTQDLTVYNSSPAATTFLGGTAQSGFSLDQAEMTRLFADKSITLGVNGSSLPAGSGNVTIGNVTLTYSGTGNIGAGGTLKISSPATILIPGNIALTTSSSADKFVIDPSLVQINTDTGSIAMLGSGGTPQGQLQIIGNTVAVATGKVLGQIGSSPDISAVNALLDVPGGTANPLQAGSISFDVINGLYVQNTGASTSVSDRRGITAGSIAIATGSNATQIVINAQLLGANGPVTGSGVPPLVLINGVAPATGGPFHPLSTINDCVLGSQCNIAPPPPELIVPAAPTGDELIDAVTSGETTDSPFTTALIQLASTTPLVNQPLVDEPITGVGNDDLWEVFCDDTTKDCPKGDDDK